MPMPASIGMLVMSVGRRRHGALQHHPQQIDGVLYTSRHLHKRQAVVTLVTFRGAVGSASVTARGEGDNPPA